MASAVGKMGGKRKVYFTVSTTAADNGLAKEYKCPSGWNPGKSRPSQKYKN
jgi:hypothetical protein